MILSRLALGWLAPLKARSIEMTNGSFLLRFDLSLLLLPCCSCKGGTTYLPLAASVTQLAVESATVVGLTKLDGAGPE